MFDSRSDHPRTGTHWHRSWQRKSTGGTRYEGVQSKHDFTPKRLLEMGGAVAVAEGLADTLVVEDFDPEQFERKGRYDEIGHLHAEALELNRLASWERELLLPFTDSEGVVHEGQTLDWFDEVEQARMDLELEEYEARRGEFDHGFGGYSDDTYTQDGQVLVDCWMPYMRMDEVRDTFGHNWAGNGFHIISPNARRTK